MIVVYCDPNIFTMFSLTCAINLGGSLLLTGGFHALSRVTEYSGAGFVRDLPPLQQGRRSHGWTFFQSEEGTKVRY